ncbi:MAG: CAP domain-containing protein [Peptococcaceae bacterium]
MNWKKYLPLFLILTVVITVMLGFLPAVAADNQGNQSALEIEMLEYVNQARQAEGLAPLKMAPRLVELARLKSQDMIDHNYFSHTSPTYGSPFDMMGGFGITYRTAGENLAGHYSVPGAHEALMNSSGHRANILNPSFTHVGIGIVKGGPYGMMFTQLFAGQPQFSGQADTAGPDNGSDTDTPVKEDTTDWTAYLAELINTERQEAGLSKLILDENLINAAQIKAEEMVVKNYLDHRSPTYGNIDEMLRKLAIPFREVKENIVGSPDIKLGHEALMDSKRHQEIILDPGYTKLGLGVQGGGRYGYNIVEVFVKEQAGAGETEEAEPAPRPEQPKPSPQPEPSPQPTPGSDYGEVRLAKQLLNLINKERVNNGLQQLTVNENLAEIARLKARDMVDHNYLNYSSPTYGRTSEMLSAAGVEYSLLTESIVAASRVETAHDALMSSAKHKDNILNPGVQEIGLGIVKSPRYGYIMVEVFLGRDEADPVSRPDPEPSPDLDPDKDSELTKQEQMEYQMLDLINKERREAGVAPLKMDRDLVKIARLKSQDMIAKNYFSHTSPTYGSPFEMMDKFGIDYRSAGENLAGHYSVTGAHEALMDSPGHRRNILDPNFTHIGIGIGEGGPYKIMFTQMFVGY